jgi:hypothetical protein
MKKRDPKFSLSYAGTAEMACLTGAPQFKKYARAFRLENLQKNVHYKYSYLQNNLQHNSQRVYLPKTLWCLRCLLGIHEH